MKLPRMISASGESLIRTTRLQENVGWLGLLALMLMRAAVLCGFFFQRSHLRLKRGMDDVLDFLLPSTMLHLSSFT